MMEDYFDKLEDTLCSNELYVRHEVEKVYTSLVTGYFYAKVVFVDGSKLVVFEHIRIEAEQEVRTDYRYHYMTVDNRMIFRYDNAPHHRDIATFPHHKHVKNNILESTAPNLAIVLREIVITIITGYMQ